MFFGVCFQHFGEQLFGRRRLKMVLVVTGFPGAVGTTKDDAVALARQIGDDNPGTMLGEQDYINKLRARTYVDIRDP